MSRYKRLIINGKIDSLISKWITLFEMKRKEKVVMNLKSLRAMKAIVHVKHFRFVSFMVKGTRERKFLFSDSTMGIRRIRVDGK